MGLADGSQAQAAPGRQIELISFEIGSQAFCIDINAVREIRGWTPATPLPQAPDYLYGVINLRGAVMPVIDLRHRLGLGRTQPSSRHVIVVVQVDSRTAGLLVDAVQETFIVDVSVMQPPPSVDAGAEQLFVDAIIPRDDCMLSRLVVDALLPAGQREAA